MRSEPTSISLSGRRAGGVRSRSVARRHDSPLSRSRSVGPPDAVDEAFALLPLAPPRAPRVDDAPPPGSDHSQLHDGILLSDLAKKVAAIDRQCETLTELLRRLQDVGTEQPR